MSTSKLRTAALVFLGVLLVANLGLRAVLARRFLPEKVLAGWAGREVRTVLLGNSLLAAAGDEAELARALEGHPNGPAANFAIGSTHLPEHLLILRRVLSRSHPRVVVYGWSAGLFHEELTAKDVIGNRSLILTWGTLGDLKRQFPELPRRGGVDLVALAVRRAIPMLTWASMVQGRVESYRSRLVNGDEESNQFGHVADFQALGRSLWEHAPEVLARNERPGGFLLSSDALALRDEAHRAGARVFWVSMPVTAAIHRGAMSTPLYQRFEASARAQLAGAQDRWLDASALPELSDRDFSDGLHLGPGGAATFSRWLAARIRE